MCCRWNKQARPCMYRLSDSLLVLRPCAKPTEVCSHLCAVVISFHVSILGFCTTSCSCLLAGRHSSAERHCTQCKLCCGGVQLSCTAIRWLHVEVVGCHHEIHCNLRFYRHLWGRTRAAVLLLVVHILAEFVHRLGADLRKV